jgi:hypothetical protein
MGAKNEAKKSVEKVVGGIDGTEAENPLAAHARRELEIAGLFDKDGIYGDELAHDVMQLIDVFAKQNHSGATAPLVIQAFYRVSMWDMLTEPTDDPDEWEKLEVPGGGDAWRNKRSPVYYSGDGGKHWNRSDSDTQGTSKPYGKEAHGDEKGQA